jgi:hypothetical protein
VNTFLHVGCGASRKEHTTPAFAGAGWRELRLDIDERVAPDIVGTMTDMAAVADASVGAIFSAHNLEHLYPHEVPLAIAEFLRVLTADGFAIITCPDLQSVAALVAQDKLVDIAYVSPAGPVAPLDMLFGYRPQLALGNLFMAHHCGFTRRALADTLAACGFQSVASVRRESAFDLWAVASKNTRSEAELRVLAAGHFPP